jgi:hypothetical protein
MINYSDHCPTYVFFCVFHHTAINQHVQIWMCHGSTCPNSNTQTNLITFTLKLERAINYKVGKKDTKAMKFYNHNNDHQDWTIYETFSYFNFPYLFVLIYRQNKNHRKKLTQTAASFRDLNLNKDV